MERNIAQSQESELFATTLHLYALAANPNVTVDAVAVFPGLGETWRVQQAHEYAKSINKPLLVAGVYAKERTFIDYSTVSFDVDAYIQGTANNTPDQAIWLVSTLLRLNINRVAFVVSPYHLYRAYSTILAQLIKSNLQQTIHVFPRCVQQPPSIVIPETGTTAWDMVAGEYQRILTYRQKHDVASNTDLKSYIDFLWLSGL